jgi:hypothetical protein
MKRARPDLEVSNALRLSLTFEALSKSSQDSQDVRFMIAAYSPQQILEVGLLNYHSEKNPSVHEPVGVVVRSLRSDLFVNCREYGHFSRTSGE